MKKVCPECKGRGEEEYDYPRREYELGGDWEAVWEACHTCLGSGEVDVDPETILTEWCDRNNLPQLDVFDIMSRKDLTKDQKAWLTQYIVQLETEDAN